VSCNFNLHSQSPWSLFNGTWQKRPRELDYRLRFQQISFSKSDLSFGYATPQERKKERKQERKNDEVGQLTQTPSLVPKFTTSAQLHHWYPSSPLPWVPVMEFG